MTARVSVNPRIVVEAPPAIEFLMTLATISQPSFMETMEVGRGWLGATEQRAGPALIDRLREFSTNDRNIWLNLLAFVSTLPEPRDVPTFLEGLRNACPREVNRYLAGFYGVHLARGPHAPVQLSVDRVLLGRAIDGEMDAVAEVLRSRSLPFPAALLSADRAATTRRLVEIVEEWASSVWPTDENVILPILERDVAAKKALLRNVPFDHFMDLATPGVRWPSAPAVRTVVVAPTYVSRPWVTHAAATDTMIVVYPASDESLGPTSDVPTRRVARLAAAYRAQHRLGIVGALSAGDRTLPELADLVGVPWDTLLHDVVKLRSAGLLTADAETRRYALRSGSVPDFGQLLGVFVSVHDMEASAKPRDTLTVEDYPGARATS